MHDCAIDVTKYHDGLITLHEPERAEMRTRRNANRDRLKRGLLKVHRPGPKEFVSQGGYSMKTMTQHPAKDYDIDDGVYFDAELLVGPRGAGFGSLDARQMVRDALDDGSFKTPPKVRKNCVRVQYDAGYHVDVPVYRCVTTSVWGQMQCHYELASSSWRRSDARDVTDWFNAANKAKSPDTENGRQLRRVVRLLKGFARSRSSWKGQILSGFGITKLVVDHYVAEAGRDDKALYYTMQAIRNRLHVNLVVPHPVTPGDTITNGYDDSRACYLHDRLDEALETLSGLWTRGCTHAEALKCWDRVFFVGFFSLRDESAARASRSLLQAASAAPGASDLAFPDRPRGDFKPRAFA